MKIQKTTTIKLSLLGLSLFYSCNLVIGLEKENLPQKTIPCQTNEDCDDGNECTEDRCELTTNRCSNMTLPFGTVCRPATGECDIEEKCNASYLECPPDSFKEKTEICRPSKDPNGICDPPEYCSGNSPQCPPDVLSAEGTPCDDENECTYDDSCKVDGTCNGTAGLSSVTYISEAGEAEHICSIISGNKAKCWGKGGNHQLGNGSVENTSLPVQVSGITEGDNILQIASGGTHTCALMHSGRIFCWGGNDSGQLGIDSLEEKVNPAEVEEVGDYPAWDYVTTGYKHTCAIHRYGGVFCWGNNERGQLGNGSTQQRTFPEPVIGIPQGSVVLKISAGHSHTCAILSGGEVYCWGDNTSGQIGNPAISDFTNVAVAVEGLEAEAVEVAAGSRHTCIITRSDTENIICWGDEGRGQLGNPEAQGGNNPVKVLLGNTKALIPLTLSHRTLCAGEYHSCAILDDGSPTCWGAGDSGQLGNGNESDSNEPVSIMGAFDNAISISCGLNFSCVLTDKFTVFCWGDNSKGQIGNGTFNSSSTPSGVGCI